jgi:phenylalanyl-tRNA synthetase alpha subunit
MAWNLQWLCAPRLSKSLSTLAESMVATVSDLDKLTAQNTLEEHKLLYDAAEQAVVSFASAQKSAQARVRESKPATEKKPKKDKKAKNEKVNLTIQGQSEASTSQHVTI